MTPEEHYRKAEELAELATDHATSTFGSDSTTHAAVAAGLLHLRLAEVALNAPMRVEQN